MEESRLLKTLGGKDTGRTQHNYVHNRTQQTSGHNVQGNSFLYFTEMGL